MCVNILVILEYKISCFCSDGRRDWGGTPYPPGCPLPTNRQSAHLSRQPGHPCPPSGYAPHENGYREEVSAYHTQVKLQYMSVLLGVPFYWSCYHNKLSKGIATIIHLLNVATQS